MIIKFTNYAEGIHEIHFAEPAANLGLSEEFVDDVVVNVKMDKSFHQIVLTTNIIYSAKQECDRCTTEYIEEFEQDVKIIYLFEQKEKQTEDTEVHFLDPDEDIIDIRSDVIDFVRLGLPMKKLCDDECKGLCSGCGVNLNEEDCKCDGGDVNPVWAPLLKLKDKSDNK